MVCVFVFVQRLSNIGFDILSSSSSRDGGRNGSDTRRTKFLNRVLPFAILGDTKNAECFLQKAINSA